jgi:hypothetical protein
MGLTPSQAIDAYLKLEPILSVGPAKDEEEGKCNSEGFDAAFRGVLSDARLEANAPMVRKWGSGIVRDNQGLH